MRAAYDTHVQPYVAGMLARVFTMRWIPHGRHIIHFDAMPPILVAAA